MEQQLHAPIIHVQGTFRAHRESDKSLVVKLILPTLEKVTISLSELSAQFITSPGQSLSLIVLFHRSLQDLLCGHVAPLLYSRQ